MWGIGTWPGGLEAGAILLPAVQRVMWRSITAITIHLGVRIITGTRATIVPPFTMANTEWICGSSVIAASGIVQVLSHMPW